jgi:hypothetical protein
VADVNLSPFTAKNYLRRVMRQVEAAKASLWNPPLIAVQQACSNTSSGEPN